MLLVTFNEFYCLADDDFDAFYALAATTSTLDVQVTVIRSNRINGASRLPEQTVPIYLLVNIQSH
jgi:hypothetical protein